MIIILRTNNFRRIVTVSPLPAGEDCNCQTIVFVDLRVSYNVILTNSDSRVCASLVLVSENASSLHENGETIGVGTVNVAYCRYRVSRSYLATTVKAVNMALTSRGPMGRVKGCTLRL
jgi:hypothetical protein